VSLNHAFAKKKKFQNAPVQTAFIRRREANKIALIFRRNSPLVRCIFRLVYEWTTWPDILHFFFKGLFAPRNGQSHKP